MKKCQKSLLELPIINFKLLKMSEKRLLEKQKYFREFLSIGVVESLEIFLLFLKPAATSISKFLQLEVKMFIKSLVNVQNPL